MESTRENLLSFGFVREYCNENNIDFLPKDIVSLFILWLTFCDRFDENLLNEHIQLETMKNEKYGEYQQIKLKDASTKRLFSTVCEGVIEKGDKQTWTFKVDGSQRVILGIIDDKVVTKRKGNIRIFAFSEGGYGLYLVNMYRYLESVCSKGYFKYGKQLKIKQGDMITMQLDLTEKNGVLRFTFNADLNDPKSHETLDNIFYDEIDVDKKWRAAVTIGSPAIVTLLPYNA